MSEAAQIGTEFVFIYTPLPSVEAAERLARALVEAKLAACVNIYPGVVSLYEWKGEIARESEVVAFIKTRRAIADEAMAAARALHPYDVPALLVLPIAEGNQDYLAWARARLRP